MASERPVGHAFVLMQLAVISDLHLGAKDEADPFGHDDAEFMRFLDHLEANFERIVLLGDIWETLTPRRLGNMRGALIASREAHPEIAKRFTRPKYTYIHGNHDLVAGVAEGVPEERVIEADGWRMLLTHGHHHDILIQRARWLSELGVWFGGWLRRVGLSGLYTYLDDLDHRREGAVLDPETCTFQRWAVALARRREVDVVITGHTHLAARSEHGDQLFLNSGSCSRGRISYLAIDTARGDASVQKSW